MGNQSQIRQHIQARIHASQLPYADFYELYRRKGDGLPCACCDDPLTSPQIEYDVELCSAMGALTTLPMHARCYYAWHEVSTAIRNGEHAACSAAACSAAISVEALPRRAP